MILDGYDSYLNRDDSLLAHSLYSVMLAEAHLACQQFDLALQAVDHGISISARHGELAYLTHMNMVRGQILIELGKNASQEYAEGIQLAQSRKEPVYEFLLHQNVGRHLENGSQILSKLNLSKISVDSSGRTVARIENSKV